MNCQIASQAVKNLALEVVGHVEVSHDLETSKTVKKHLTSALLVLKVKKKKENYHVLIQSPIQLLIQIMRSSLGFFQLSKRGNEKQGYRSPHMKMKRVHGIS